MKRWTKGLFAAFALVLALATLLIAGSGTAVAAAGDPEPEWYAPSRAYQVAFTHWDPPWEPHFGAWFYQPQCYDPHYTAEDGDATTAPYQGGIGSWDWWGGSHNVLLVPKSFLIANPIPRYTGDNYLATCWYD